MKNKKIKTTEVFTYDNPDVEISKVENGFLIKFSYYSSDSLWNSDYGRHYTDKYIAKDMAEVYEILLKQWEPK